MDEITTTTAETSAIAEQLSKSVLNPLKAAYVGKDEVIDLLGICLLSGENLFVIGPPGTAKSAIVRSLATRLDVRVFDYLLTRFTEPSELFGPFDIRKLREGELLTNTEGMLPEADILFLDELLNANSAILNSLLMALNERVFRRGRETRQLGFVLVVGASNRLPEDDALAALFDRFLLRVRSDNVPPELLTGVLEAGWQLQNNATLPAASPVLSVAAIRQLQSQVARVDVTAVRTDYVALVSRLRHAGIAISDRRAVKLQRLIAASALMCGRASAHASDMWVLRYIWDTMEQVDVLAQIVNEAISASGHRENAATEATASQHPRSQGSDAPNPEFLSSELDQIESQLSTTDRPSNQSAWLRDRLGLLAARVEWVPIDATRDFLRERIETLLGQLS